MCRKDFGEFVEINFLGMEKVFASLAALGNEHSCQLQAKDVLIQDLSNRLEQTQKINAELADRNDALEQQVWQC